MTNQYRLVQWNHHKKVYDLLLAGAIVVYLVAFIGVSAILHTGDNAISVLIVLIRAFGTGAIVLLHVVLAIGPLARLSPRFSPLLYNRRHLGVTTFLLGLIHATLVLVFYGGSGGENPVSAVLGANSDFTSVTNFPYTLLGFVALLILFLMAATSHDFWLANLGARFWKWLHMLVYVAYALLVMHVVLGVLQSEKSLLYPILLGAGAITLGGLHVVAGLKEAAKTRAGLDARGEWVDVCAVDELEEKRGKVVCLKSQERVAIFKYDGKLSAISNVCKHQGGPLGEGQIIDGCVTCPWHGYQYLPENGQSPPPYTEKIPTYEVRVEGDRVLLNPKANEPGTPVEPVRDPKASES